MTRKIFGIGLALVIALTLVVPEPAVALGDKEASWLRWLVPVGLGVLFQGESKKANKKVAKAQTAALTAAAKEKSEAARKEAALANIAEVALEKARNNDFGPASQLFVGAPAVRSTAVQSPVVMPISVAASQAETANQPAFVLGGWKEGLLDWETTAPEKAFDYTSLLVCPTSLPARVELRSPKGLFLEWEVPARATGEEEATYANRALADYDQKMRVAVADPLLDDQLEATAYFSGGNFRREVFNLGGQAVRPALAPVVNPTLEEEAPIEGQASVVLLSQATRVVRASSTWSTAPTVVASVPASQLRERVLEKRRKK